MKYLDKDVQAILHMGQPVKRIYHMSNAVWEADAEPDSGDAVSSDSVAGDSSSGSN